MISESARLSIHLQEIAKFVSDEIESICDRKVGFTLIVFTNDRANYISNVNREESIGEIKKLLDLWGMGMPDIPAHQVL